MTKLIEIVRSDNSKAMYARGHIAAHRRVENLEHVLRQIMDLSRGKRTVKLTKIFNAANEDPPLDFDPAPFNGVLSAGSVLAAIAGAALDPVVAMDRSQKVVYWNSQAEECFGWTAQEALGRPLHELVIPARDRQRHIDTVTRLNLTGEPQVLGRRREVTAVRRDGTEIQVEVALLIAPHISGDMFVAFLRDLTPQKDAARLIEELQSEVVHLSRVNAMSTMASVLAHELNQPLAAAASYLGTACKLKDGPPLENMPTPWELVESARKAVHRAGDTIKSVRRMVSNAPHELESASVTEMAAEISRLLGGSLRVLPFIDVAADADCVSVSRVQIEQVLLNLLKNANEAVFDLQAPAIQVSARRLKNQVEITVSNNGPAIPPHVGEMLFSAGPSHKKAGMGIGLSICRTILEQHGGKIWHHAEGGLTSFSFTVARSAIQDCLTDSET